MTAEELHLTPGAISRQMKSLEDALEIQLFRRTHNSIALTDAGRQYLAHVNAALATIENGTRALQPDRAEIVIQAPITLARRWLIPRLGSFRHEHPTIDLNIQSLALGASQAPNIVMTYRRGLTEGEFEHAFLLDRTIAVCSPLLVNAASQGSPQSVLDLPILLDTADAWSWRTWSAAAGLEFRARGGTIAFDTDEASIDACISGLGIGQASPSLVEKELREGQLLALFSSIQPIVGAYEIVSSDVTEAADAFNRWLISWRDAGNP